MPHSPETSTRGRPPALRALIAAPDDPAAAVRLVRRSSAAEASALAAELAGRAARDARYPVVMARFEAPPRRARTLRSRSREPQERILATPPAHRRETIVGPINLSTFFDVWCAGRSSPPSGDPPSTSGCG